MEGIDEKTPLEHYREEYSDKTPVELAAAMHDVAAEIAIIDEHRKKRAAEYDAIRKYLLPERMEDEGLSNMKITGIGRISLRTDVYASILAVNKDVAYDWLRGTGHGGIIKETVHAGTLKALMKTIIKEGGDLPPEEIVKVQPYTIAVLTKAK